MDLVKGKRVGLLGGTFDPVHLGHLAVAEAVCEKLHLDSILFIPAHQPPHKCHFGTSPFFHRSAMLELALNAMPRFHISYMEAERNGFSFTCDTLADIRGTSYADTMLFFITGIDAFKEIHTWKRYKSLLHFADLAVIARPPHTEGSLNAYIKKHFITYQYSSGKNAWASPKEQGQIHVVAMDPVHISSTEIRKKIAAGEDVKYLVSDDVFAYIQEKGLYQRT